MNSTETSLLQFLEKAAPQGCLWGLCSEEGWALCSSEVHPNSDVMPFWSSPELAEIHNREDWSHYEVAAISLEEFMDDWLEGLHKDALMVGLDWDENLEGEEHEPLDVLEAFEKAYA